jgi:hypothetical protein
MGRRHGLLVCCGVCGVGCRCGSIEPVFVIIIVNMKEGRDGVDIVIVVWLGLSRSHGGEQGVLKCGGYACHLWLQLTSLKDR